MKKLTLIFSALLLSVGSYAQTIVTVSSDTELKEAMSATTKPSKIIIADGEYTSFNFTISQSGSAAEPFVVEAQTPGGVIVTDGAQVKITGSYVTLSGIYFKDGFEKGGMDKGEPVIEIVGDNVRVTQCAFVNCNNRASVASMYQSAEKRMPQFTRIDHCYFADNLGWRLYLDLGNRVPSDDPQYAMYYRIDHNYFSTPYKMAENTGSAMRIGLGQLGLGRCLIDNNLFERQDGETELIENKSHENVYISNTFRNCRSQMSFRQGRGIIFLHNQFEATDSKYRYGGLGMWMNDHIVAGNYFSLPWGAFTSLDKNIKERKDKFEPAAVQFTCGYKNFKNSDNSYASHLTAQNNTIANNLFFNCSDPIFNMAFFKKWMEINTSYDAAVPFGNIVTGNVYGYSTTSYPELVVMEEGDNTIEGNTLVTPKKGATPQYIAIESEQLTKAQEWLATIPGVAAGDFDLAALANSRVAEIEKRGKKVEVVRTEPHTFKTVGPDWLSENPSEFALSGDYTPELITTIRTNLKSKR